MEFTELFDTDYGTLLLHSFDTNQTNALKTTKKAHDHAEFLEYKNLHNSRGGGVVLDVGANYGLFSLIMSTCENTQVYGFEPQPDVFNICCANMALQSRSNVRIFPFGVGNTEQNIEDFAMPYIDPRTHTSFGSHEIHNRGREYHNTSGTIYTFVINLDWFVKSIIKKNVDFLKVDVEGMELEVLSGAKDILTNQNPIVVVEFLKSSKDNIIDTLKNFNYNSFNTIGVNIIAQKI